MHRLNNSSPARLFTRIAGLDVRSLLREIHTNQLDIVFLLTVLILAGALTVNAQQSKELQPYIVRVAVSNTLVAADDAAGGLIPDAVVREDDSVHALLQDLANAGQVGRFTFDEIEYAYYVELSDEAREELSRHPAVIGIEPAGSSTSEEAMLPLQPQAVQEVSSIVFVQVHSPFVWGRARLGGLSVELTLEDSTGDVKGVAYQSTRPAPNDYIKIDRTQLYFETVFVDPNDPSQEVMIRPGDKVHVVTTGVDPSTGDTVTEDKRVVVDDVRAWTSYENDSVSGTAPADSALTITVAKDYLQLSNYLTPGSSMTYAETTVGAGASFSINQFRTSTDATPKDIDLVQGSTGFVRVRHPDGNEVYTIHGQNVLALQNSSVLHGYAFRLPFHPNGLEAGVTVSRPATVVSATLKSSGGDIKGTFNDTISSVPYGVSFEPANILAGDVVGVSINGGPINQITIGALTANVNVDTNTVTGTGPANKQLVLGAGRINGYISAQSSFSYIQQEVTTSGSGSYASQQFECGNSNYLNLMPGSFGYAGYEDVRGNFVYIAFAAPTTHVMVDYPFLEGWIAKGTQRPDLTLRAPNGTLKSHGTATPTLLWMTLQRLFVNTYYNHTPTAFIEPGDSVTVADGSRTATIPIDALTAYVDTDTEAVVGTAPSGAMVHVIPGHDRFAYRDTTAATTGAYTAGNPYTYVSNFNCSEGTRTQDFRPGYAGRTYVQHSDGNEVFAVYGRSMHVNQNENYVEVYQYGTHDIDWYATPRRSATVTLTPKQGTPVTVTKESDYSRSGKTEVLITDAGGQKVLIRAGDSVLATFDEGPPSVTRMVTLSLNAMALVTGSPDVDIDTVAGVGPHTWSGALRLNPPPNANTNIIPKRSTTAYAPMQFEDIFGKPVPLVRGYSGTVSFTNRTGLRIWTAWAATTYPVKIREPLRVGDTRVCGVAAPGTTVRIYDVTDGNNPQQIGEDVTGSDGAFCVPVNSALYDLEVVLAEADGTYSQPVVVRKLSFVYLPLTAK